ncbi:hypothetical protein ABW19_dt0201505 [Dactylella cylindrospora]|nr:hypothetical protein ABW19_dt0201505 [Dactylella cylindrospora]
MSSNKSKGNPGKPPSPPPPPVPPKNSHRPAFPASNQRNQDLAAPASEPSKQSENIIPRRPEKTASPGKKIELPVKPEPAVVNQGKKSAKEEGGVGGSMPSHEELFYDIAYGRKGPPGGGAGYQYPFDKGDRRE